MGAHFTSGRAFTCNDSNRGRFSVELSMAAPLPSRARYLCRGSPECPAKFSHWFDTGSGTDRRDNPELDLRPGGKLWPAGHSELFSDRCRLGAYRSVFSAVL